MRMENGDVKILKKKPIYPVSSELRKYLRLYQRDAKLPVGIMICSIIMSHSRFQIKTEKIRCGKVRSILPMKSTGCTMA
jgi:hypothetical protein